MGDTGALLGVGRLQPTSPPMPITLVSSLEVTPVCARYMCPPALVPGPAAGTSQSLCQVSGPGGEKEEDGDALEQPGTQPSAGGCPNSSPISTGHCKGGDSCDTPGFGSLAPAHCCPSPAVTQSHVPVVIQEVALDQRAASSH